MIAIALLGNSCLSSLRADDERVGVRGHENSTPCVDTARISGPRMSRSTIGGWRFSFCSYVTAGTAAKSHIEKLAKLCGLLNVLRRDPNQKQSFGKLMKCIVYLFLFEAPFASTCQLGRPSRRQEVLPRGAEAMMRAGRGEVGPARPGLAKVRPEDPASAPQVGGGRRARAKFPGTEQPFLSQRPRAKKAVSESLTMIDRPCRSTQHSHK